MRQYLARIHCWVAAEGASVKRSKEESADFAKCTTPSRSRPGAEPKGESAQPSIDQAQSKLVMARRGSGTPPSSADAKASSAHARMTDDEAAGDPLRRALRRPRRVRE